MVIKTLFVMMFSCHVMFLCQGKHTLFQYWSEAKSVPAGQLATNGQGVNNAIMAMVCLITHHTCISLLSHL